MRRKLLDLCLFCKLAKSTYGIHWQECDRVSTFTWQRRNAHIHTSHKLSKPLYSLYIVHCTMYSRGLHRDWDFPFPTFPSKSDGKWEWTWCSSVTEMRIATWRWEGMKLETSSRRPRYIAHVKRLTSQSNHNVMQWCLGGEIAVKWSSLCRHWHRSFGIWKIFSAVTTST